jgi:hypothetical protein
MTIFSTIRYAVLLAASGAALSALAVVAAASQQMTPDGQALFNANCATCHGADGSGSARHKPAELGFDLPLPDFSDCSFANREADADWSSIIHKGGPVRSFPRIMPAFGEALSDDEIDSIIGYVRTFCTDSRWVRGEFNFPRGLFTEKAFPEDEVVWSNAINTNGPTAITSLVTFEKRFGPRGQLEVVLPFSILDGGPGTGTQAGFGDLELEWKQNVLANVDSGTIISLMGASILPTGNTRRGLGNGTLAFETHVLFAQALPEDFVFQGQVFAGFPLRKDRAQELAWNLNIGKTFAEDEGWGRAWTPMLEVLGSHEFASGAKTDWDIVPQLQVSLSRRQHILMDFGARIPLTNASVRNTQFLFYFVWDWYDAGLFEGWR